MRKIKPISKQIDKSYVGTIYNKIEIEINSCKLKLYYVKVNLIKLKFIEFFKLNV